jgi:hypothetical protein
MLIITKKLADLFIYIIYKILRSDVILIARINKNVTINSKL